MDCAGLPRPPLPGRLLVHSFILPAVISPAVLGAEPKAGRWPRARKGQVPSPSPRQGDAGCTSCCSQSQPPRGGDGDVPRGGGTVADPSWKGAHGSHGHRQEVGGQVEVSNPWAFPSSFTIVITNQQPQEPHHPPELSLLVPAACGSPSPLSASLLGTSSDLTTSRTRLVLAGPSGALLRIKGGIRQKDTSSPVSLADERTGAGGGWPGPPSPGERGMGIGCPLHPTSLLSRWTPGSL